MLNYYYKYELKDQKLQLPDNSNDSIISFLKPILLIHAYIIIIYIGSVLKN